MLHTETVEPSTLDLLKRLQRLPDLANTMYFDDAEEDPMPEMFDGNLTWENVKKKIIDTTRAFVLRGNV